MSPEQASGERLDVRSDVFSVGVLLYLCWTGCLPFEGVDPVDTLRLVRDARPTEVGRLRPDLPPRLREVLAKAMARDRADRFPSASVMRRALLEAALAGVESSPAAELSGASVPPPADRQEILAELAEPVTSDTRLPEQRAAPRWWIAAAVALIGMLVLLLVVVAMRGRAPTEPVVTRLPMTATSAAPPTAVSDAPTEAASAAQAEGTERVEASPAVPVVSSAPSAAEPVPAPFEPAARRGTPARVAPLREGRAPAGGAPRRAHSGLVRDPGF
jgi:serine/threonine-protein kinase